MTYLHLLFRWSQKPSHLPGAKQDARLLLHREPGPRGGFQDQNRGEIPLVTSALAVLFCMETILNTYGILPSSVLLSLSENWEMFTWALAYGAVIARALPSVANWYSPDAHNAQGWTALGTKHTHVTACLPPRQFLIRDGLESVYCTRRVQIKDFEWVNIWKALFFLTTFL